jgi:hypothetical protein
LTDENCFILEEFKPENWSEIDSIRIPTRHGGYEITSTGNIPITLENYKEINDWNYIID